MIFNSLCFLAGFPSYMYFTSSGISQFFLSQITAAKETSSGISLSFLKKILIGSKLWNIIILSQGNPD
jgi:hypothetical protein